MTPRTVQCPTCKKEVPFDSPEMPFCSKRCRMIDLGNWASEKYVIPGSATTPDAENAEQPDEPEGSGR